MRFGIKSKHGNPLKLTAFNVEVNPGETVWVEGNERQMTAVRNTPNLELVFVTDVPAEKPEEKSEKGDEE